MVEIDVIESAGAGRPLFLLSFEREGELARLLGEADWRVTAARRLDLGVFRVTGAAVAVVDARYSIDQASAAVRALAPEVEQAGAALVALVPRGDTGAIEAIYQAGATHFATEPAELVHAVRFADRFVERLGRSGAAGRRRCDPVIAAPADAVQRWAAERLSSGCGVVALRVALASFELVNTAHGRDVGDDILREAAERLGHAASELFGEDAVVVRLSGPEFALAGNAARSEAQGAVARIGDTLSRPFGQALVGVRIGAATAHPGEDAATLLRRAADQIAPAEQAGAVEDLAVDLHHAIGGGEIALLFQPQVEIATGRIVGVEALARWEHPRLGMIGADALLAAGERAGLGQPLSEHLQRLALRQAACWPAALSDLRLSINVTAEDVGGPDFADRFLDRVEQAGFPAARLTVEVTESGLIGDLGHAAALLGRLREAGCRTAIDDFGTGYSSLSYLNTLPLDYLKLDKALVSGIEHDGRERVVAHGVLSLARSLGLRTVAEGVETEVQRDLLAGEGCELYQGFLCAGAVDTPALEELMTS